MKNSTETCKNCEQEFSQGYKFCPHCGQQVKDELTIGLLFYNTISNYFSFDARFLKSFLPLMLKPGYLAAKFIEGKRLLYLHPAQLYLFVSVIFFFLMSVMVVRENVQNIDKALQKANFVPVASDSLKVDELKALDSVQVDSILNPLIGKGIEGLDQAQVKVIDSLIKNKANEDTTSSLGFFSKEVDSLIAQGAPNSEIYKAMGMEDDAGALTRKFYAQALKFKKHRGGGQILQAAYDTIPISLFILLPIFALILKLFFYKRGTYAHHLVFSFYFFAFLFTVFSLVLIINYFVDMPGSLDFLVVWSTFFYLFIAVKRFYGSDWFVSFIKTSVISFIYLSFVLPSAFIILIMVSFLYY